MKNLKSILRTDGHFIGLILRLTLGIVVLPHGCQLLFGWFGGYGFIGTMNYFTEVVGLPWLVGMLVILLQFFGALLVIAGVAVRFMALSMAILFFGMIVTSHLDHGFFMNWFGNQQGEGYEYHLLVIGLSLALMLAGSGRFSVDRWLTKKFGFSLNFEPGEKLI